MPPSSDNLELILFVWVDALRRNDAEQIAPYLAHDIVWQGLRRDLVCRIAMMSLTTSAQAVSSVLA
jgi:hypothetical protein